MALRDFQRAMCDLVADPELCLRLRQAPPTVLDRYELDERERWRLEEVVRQPGMSVNCSLYRANRIAPLHSSLPYSRVLLAERFGEQVSAFWRAQPAQLHFEPEVEAFGGFLRERIENGEAENPYLLETLEFELAFNALRLAPRRRLLAELRERQPSAAWNRHPLIRVVRFSHDPGVLLEALADGRVPEDLAEDDHYLVLDARGDPMRLKTIDPRFGRALATLAPDDSLALGDLPELTALADEGLLVPA